MGNLRRVSEGSEKKEPVCLTFTGKQGKRALEILGGCKKNFGYSKSGLVVDLINIFQEYVDKYGADMAMYKLLEGVRRED